MHYFGNNIKNLIKDTLNNDDKEMLYRLAEFELISKLGKYDIEQLLIEEIPLEDLFMNYYK